ncbi:MAG: hypothetical protein GF308_14160 [Candidatus Heimdallarchaeota archaeon]|nr:hypothetical protein [Candidatus Heimdallarchaeota archaeon]
MQDTGRIIGLLVSLPAPVSPQEYSQAITRGELGSLPCQLVAGSASIGRTAQTPR